MQKPLTSKRYPKEHPDYDPEWDSPEALAKWRTRMIRDPAERAQAFHKMWKELEVEERAASEARANDGPMRESEIEAGFQQLFNNMSSKTKPAES